MSLFPLKVGETQCPMEVDQIVIFSYGDLDLEKGMTNYY